MDTSRDRTTGGTAEHTWPEEREGRPLGEQAGRVAERISEQASRLGEQAGRVTELAAARGRGLVNTAREQAQQAAEYVQDAVQQTREKVAEYREGGLDRIKEDAVTYTRQQPVTALLIAAGIGLLVGWLTAAARR